MLSKTFLMTFVLLFISSLAMLFIVDDKLYKFIAKFILYSSIIIPAVTVFLYKTIGVSQSKAIFANTFLFIVTISVILVAAEYFVRFVFLDITTTADNSSFFANRWRDENKPSLNSLGYREREIINPKPSGVYRIAVVGDSLTYGQGLAEQERYSRVIENKLSGGRPDYQVYNFGVPGAETINHISFLDDVFKINPDFILLQWFSNDVEGQNKSARPKSYRLIPSDYLTRTLHNNSALYFLINVQWTALQVHLGLVGTYNESMHTRFRDKNSPDSKRAISELDTFIKKVKDKNIQLGIVMFPNFGNKEGGAEKYPFIYLFERVLEACNLNEIKCLDMRTIFAKESPEALWLNRFDQHPSKLANEIAARSILEAFFTD